MSSFSISRVAQYARYHYISQGKNYISLLLAILAMPVIFGVLSRSIETAADMSMAIYLFAGIGFACRTTFPMRGRGTKILESVVPISNEERFAFMLFNLMVIYPLSVLLMASLSLVLVYPFSYGEQFGAEFIDMLVGYYLEWPIYILVQIITAGSLLINLLARRNLFVAYLGAFVGVILFFGVMANIGIEILMSYSEEMRHIEIASLPEPIAITIYCLFPIVIYVIGYFVLRKRQIKW